MISDVAEEKPEEGQTIIKPSTAPKLEGKKSKQQLNEPSPKEINEEQQDVVELVFPQLKSYLPRAKQSGRIKSIDDMTVYKSIQHQ